MTEPTVTLGGRYVLEERIGAGGMGEVWRARHVTLKTHFAIKLLLGASASQEATRARFLTEAQVTAQLRSKHAVQVYDFGFTDDGRPYLVMELLDGETLADRLIRGAIGPAETVTIIRQTARALERAHAMGIVHRDFKPSNILLCRDEEGCAVAKVVDFGVAKLMGQLDEIVPDEVVITGRRSLTSFTRTGTMLGTPHYMAPEQVRGSSDIGPGADIWALGVVTYECLTGCPPFDADDLEPLFERIRKGEHVDASSLVPGLPLAFDIWFETACAVDPAARFPTAEAAATELADAMGIHIEAPPASVIAPPRARSSNREALTLDAPPEPSARGLSGVDRFAIDMDEGDPGGGRFELDVRGSVPVGQRATSRPEEGPSSSAPTPRFASEPGARFAISKPPAARPPWVVPVVVFAIVMVLGVLIGIARLRA